VTANPILLGCSSIAYLAAGVLYQCNFLPRWRPMARYGTGAAVVALAIHSAALVVFAFEEGHLPVTNIAESLAVFAWLGIIAYLLVEHWRDVRVVGAFAFPLLFLLVLGAAVAMAGGHAASPERAAKLTPVWLLLHVTPSLLSYAAFLLAFCSGAMYLLHARLLKVKRLGGAQGALPSLETLDGLSYRLVAFGFVMLTIGIGTGVAWYGRSLGDYWGWVRAEMGPMVTWAVYAAYIHARMVAGWHRARAMWLLVVGFVVVLVTYLVTHSLLPGPHREPPM
jgi:cytochrome c-type biogenesis protein CcsB